MKAKKVDEIFVDMVVKRLRELRNERSYSQEYVIEHTHLDISRYESGNSIPTLLSILKLCNLYNITLEEFFTSFDYPPKK